MVNYGEAIKKPFTDLIKTENVKLTFGILLSLIPIVQWFAKGFALESSGLGKTRPSPKMPEWKHFGHLFIKGLLSDIIFFVYMLPALVIFLIGAGIILAPLASTIISSMFTQEVSPVKDTESMMLKNLIQQNWVLLIPNLIVAAPILLVAFVLFLFASYVGPIAILNYVKTNKFGQAFNFDVIFRKTLNVKYFIVWLVTIILVGIISAILSWVPFIGRGIAYFITAVISFSIYGQIFREIK
jgi:hypothetical protein